MPCVGQTPPSVSKQPFTTIHHFSTSLHMRRRSMTCSTFKVPSGRIWGRSWGRAREPRTTLHDPCVKTLHTLHPKPYTWLLHELRAAGSTCTSAACHIKTCPGTDTSAAFRLSCISSSSRIKAAVDQPAANARCHVSNDTLLLTPPAAAPAGCTSCGGFARHVTSPPLAGQQVLPACQLLQQLHQALAAQ